MAVSHEPPTRGPAPPAWGRALLRPAVGVALVVVELAIVLLCATAPRLSRLARGTRRRS